MVTANQKSTIDTHTHKRKENSNTTLKLDIKSQNKRGREEKRPSKTNPKQLTMAIRTYISIITLNVNGLNAPTKIHRLAE